MSALSRVEARLEASRHESGLDVTPAVHAESYCSGLTLDLAGN